MPSSFDDRFGDYLLFRRLSESPLGSTFRAGRLQARAVDRVVLLQRFDGPALDSERLAEAVGERAGLLDRLTAPEFAPAIGAGIEEGAPFVAYDYLLGRSLERIFERATAKEKPVEPVFLLALVEQAAASLAAAARLRHEGIPLRHGFLVPELLLLSAEGRVLPLAFTHGAALAQQETLRELYSLYLAPETRHGEAAFGDDVYSLAAILFEGLTGAPPKTEEATAAQVDQALFSAGGTPIGPDIQAALKAGLAPFDARPDMGSFRRLLREALDREERPPTQFQLAFFLHQLFRDELETEAVEMQSERTARFDPVLLAPGFQGGNAGSETEGASEGEEVAADDGGETGSDGRFVDSETPPPLPTGRDSRGARSFVTGLALSLAVALGAAGILQLVRRAPAVADSGPTQASTGPSPTVVEGELRRLVTAGATDLQNRLEEEYEPRLTRLRNDIARAKAKREREVGPANRLENPVPALTPPPASEGPSPDATASREDASKAQPIDGQNNSGTQQTAPSREETGGGSAIESPIASGFAVDEQVSDAPATVADPVDLHEPPLSPTNESDDPVAPGSAHPGGFELETGDPGSAVLPLTEPANSVPSTPSSAAEETRVAAETSPPRLLAPPKPRYPPQAQRLGKTARVQVRVLVDPEGRASETEIVSAAPGFGFDRAALDAARRTRWQPATRDGETTAAWAILTIDFRL